MRVVETVPTHLAGQFSHHQPHQQSTSLTSLQSSPQSSHHQHQGQTAIQQSSMDTSSTTTIGPFSPPEQPSNFIHSIFLAPNVKLFLKFSLSEPTVPVQSSPSTTTSYTAAQPSSQPVTQPTAHPVIQSKQSNSPTVNTSVPNVPSVSSVASSPMVSSTPTITTVSPMSGSNYVYSEQQTTSIVHSSPNSMSTKQTQQHQINQVRRIPVNYFATVSDF